MKQAHVFISGFVQRVGFRVFVRNSARKKNITGWVRNLSDGRVEGVLLGDKNAVSELIRQCHKGTFLAEVKEVDVQWEDVTETFDTFTIFKDA